jgi:hypothetical protein
VTPPLFANNWGNLLLASGVEKALFVWHCRLLVETNFPIRFPGELSKIGKAHCAEFRLQKGETRLMQPITRRAHYPPNNGQSMTLPLFAYNRGNLLLVRAT